MGAEIETDYGDPLTVFELLDVLPKGLDVQRVVLTNNSRSCQGHVTRLSPTGIIRGGKRFVSWPTR